jgi:hypothetical protein
VPSHSGLLIAFALDVERADGGDPAFQYPFVVEAVLLIAVRVVASSSAYIPIDS